MADKLDFNSDLIRKGWVKEGLLQEASKSFWAPMTGTTQDSIVHMAKKEDAKEGHTVVFDHDGNIVAKPIFGDDKAFGKGETKKKFSDRLTVERYRHVVDNGDHFDAKEIDSLDLNNHSDSRRKLSDKHIRFKDQCLFDVAQGLINGETPSHIFDLGSTFEYNTLNDITTDIKFSRNYDTGAVRRPLEPYRMKDGEACWLFMMDSLMANRLKNSPNYQSVIQQADVRGEQNRLIKGIFGKIGQLYLVEAPIFFGDTPADTPGNFQLSDSSVEISGLRQRDANGLWTGQEGFDPTGDLFSRGLLLGTNALHLAYGMMPDYKHQYSEDFKIKSESALVTYMHAQKVKLKAERDDYKEAKVAGHDYGIVAVDLQVQ